MLRKKKTIVVKEYETQKQYERDANKMHGRGYVVHETTTKQPKRSLGKAILSGFIFHRPKPVTVVTYHLAPEPQPDPVK